MSRTILGARIRERRRHLGITQADLARRLEISPSYLNLIEHNKRSIAGSLLRRAAQALELTPEDLDGAAERRLLETLEEIAHSPAIAALGAEQARTGELIGRFPGWARALAALARSEHQATDVARSFADRLAHDPFLAETVHRMLTQIAALRSAAEILVDYPQASAAQRDRFVAILCDQSRALSEVGEALAAYFDKAEAASRVLTPHDEVEALFGVRGNHFAEIEAKAQSLAAEPGDGPSAGTATARQRALPELAERAVGELCEQIIERQSQVATALACGEAREALLTYAGHALRAPMASFAPRARELRYDAELLARAFDVPMETVCHRLSALPPSDADSGDGKPGDASGTPRFGYFRANAAGTIVQNRNLPELGAPHYGSACPLWALYRAQQNPQSTLHQRVVFPDGERFVFIAWATPVGEPGFARPRHYMSDMLALRERDARHTVYAARAEQPVEAVGTSCRSCAHRDCRFRVAGPLTS